jgi:hypothetical protein
MKSRKYAGKSGQKRTFAGAGGGTFSAGARYFATFMVIPASNSPCPGKRQAAEIKQVREFRFYVRRS